MVFEFKLPKPTNSYEKNVEWRNYFPLSQSYLVESLNLNLELHFYHSA